MGLNADTGLEREADIMGSRASAGLPASIGRAFASDFSDVRVHDGGDAAALGALAYTGGSDIHVGRGAEQLLGHEAAHVVQQRQGAVSAFGHLAE